MNFGDNAHCVSVAFWNQPQRVFQQHLLLLDQVLQIGSKLGRCLLYFAIG